MSAEMGVVCSLVTLERGVSAGMGVGSGTGRVREWCISSGLTRERDVSGEVGEEFGFEMNTAF